MLSKAVAFFLVSVSAFAQIGAPFTGHQRGVQWFVDVVNGSDSNTGHALSTGGVSPFKTIAHLMAQPPHSYDHIYLASGSCEVWREELLLNALPHVTVSSYGSGAMPVLAADDIITGTDGCTTGTGSWTLDASDATNQTFQAAMSTPADGGSGTVNFFVDGVVPTLATSKANCEATPGSYYPSSFAGNSWTLYYHSLATVNPGTDGHLYEVASRQSGLYAETSDYTTVIGIKTRRNHTNDGSLTASNFATFVNVEADDGSKHNVLFGDGSNINGLVMIGARSGDATCCTLAINYPRNGNGLSAPQASFNNITGSLASSDGRIDFLGGHTGFYSITGASWSGGVATFTTAANLLISGIPLQITGVVPSGYNTSNAGVVGTVIDTTHFSIPIASNPGTWTSGGVVATNLAPATVTNLTCLNTAKALLGGYWTSLNGVSASNCGGISTWSLGGTVTVKNANLGVIGSGTSALIMPYPVTLNVDTLTATCAVSGVGCFRVQLAATGSSLSLINSTLSNTSSNGFASAISVESADLVTFNLQGNTFPSPTGTTGVFISMATGHAPATSTINNNTYHYTAMHRISWAGTTYDLSLTSGQNSWKALSFAPDSAASFVP